MIYAIIGLLFLLADQFLKFWTVAHIDLNANPGKELIPGALNMTYIKNAGAAFGLGSNFPALRWILLGLLIAFTAFIVLGIAKGFLRTGFARWTGTLLLAGLLGNGIDRAIYGYVVDMFEPKLGSISWPIFNLADALVVIFGILFCIAVIAGGIGSPDDYEDDDYLDDEDEEEERPRRRRARRDEEDEEEEAPVRRRRARRDEEDGEEEAPIRRRARRVKEEEDDEEEAPAPRRRPTAQEAEAVVRRRERPAAPESDATVRTVERPAVREEPKKEARPAVRPAADPAAKSENKSAPRAESKPAPKPEPAPAPKPEPEPEPAPAKSGDEFDLESILAEFK